MLKDRTAAELADALEGMPEFPHNTGGLSMLDEATLDFGDKSAEFSQAQHFFSRARHDHLRSYANGSYSEVAWRRVTDAP